MKMIQFLRLNGSLLSSAGQALHLSVPVWSAWCRGLLLLLVVSAFSSGCGAGSAPGVSASESKSNHVRIYRDSWGVPYIYADVEEDAYFGLGYSLAQDRPERFYELVLWGTGQWAAAKGDVTTPLGLPAVVLDQWASQWMHVEEAKAAFGRLDAQTRKNFESFARGFEHFFSLHPEMRPTWAPKLMPWHPVAILRGVMWPFSMINDGLSDCRRGGIQVSQAGNASTQENIRFASNEWALMPDKTANGATILLSDPHGPIDAGLIFNEFNIRAGRVHVSAYGIGPIAILGHTPRIAWAATTGAPDMSDCFAIEVDPSNPRRYKYDDEWREMEVRDAVIEVKGSEPIKKTYEYTRHNGVLSPVVARDGDKAYVISTPYMHEGSSGIEEFQKFVLADDVDDAFEAMRDPKILGQNYMFADHKGNVLYVRAGRAPRRPGGYDWTIPVPGNTSETRWLGIHPVDDLVWVKNPTQGYMKNTNEGPNHIVRDNSPIKPEDFEEYIYNAPGFTTSRAFRLAELLADARSVTIEDAVSITMDETLPFTRRWLAALELAAGSSSDVVRTFSPNHRKVLNSIMAFDGVMDQTSTTATQYLFWRDALQSKLSLEQSSEIMGDDPDALMESVDAAVADSLLGAIKSSTERLLENFGTIAVPYGDIFRLGRGKRDWPLGGGTICLDAMGNGCDETLRAFAVRGGVATDGRRQPQYGSRMIRLVSFGKSVEAYAAFNFGQSDDSSSVHFDDQTALLSQKKLRRVYESEDELIAAGASRQELSVPKRD